MTFADELWAETRRVDFRSLRFVQDVRAGTSPLDRIRAYAVELAFMAEGFTAQLAGVLASCDNREVRHAVLSNLLEEEGVRGFDGHHLTAPLEHHHGEMARTMARALGADLSRPTRPLRSAWLDQRLREGRWLGALAFMTVGFEANVPAVFAPLVEGLRAHYGYSDDDLRYLMMHVTADAEHGAEGVEMVARAAVTPEAKRDALTGARHGTIAWYHVHRRYGQRVERRPTT